MSILDNFELPEGVAEDMASKGLKLAEIEDGVSTLTSGHDQGLSIRFYEHQTYNKQKSDKAKYEVFDKLEMIEWFIDKNNKIPEQVKFLPEELLKFDSDGDCIGGRLMESYLRYKEGKATIGTPLRKWGVTTDNEIASLEAIGIFTVEQFAAYDKSRIESRYPESFSLAHTRAVQFVAGKDQQTQADEILLLKENNGELLKRLEALESAPGSGRPRIKKDLLASKINKKVKNRGEDNG